MGGDDSNDLSSDVTALSTKLIEAIEGQSKLEDQVQSMRREMEALRKEKTSMEQKMESMVEKPLFDKEVELKSQAEKKSQDLQAEIEELSGSLFDEANKMVAEAKRDTALWAKRNQQLQLQLKERDTLLENLQQQLSGLKTVLQDMTDQEQQQQTQELHSKRASNGLAMMRPPSTQSLQPSPMQENPSNEAAADSDEYSLSSLVRPVVRMDLASFNEFKSLARNIKHVHQTSLSTSAASTNTKESPTTTPDASPVSATPATTTTSRYHFNFTSPVPPSSLMPPPAYQAPSLKEFKFFKRALSDDIDPTLRLDQAPGLSWLARRNIMSSILEGTAIVEPISGVNEGYKFSGNNVSSHSTASESGHLYSYPQGGPPVATKTPCKFCGELRDNNLLYARMHNIRIDKRDSSVTPTHSASSSVSGALGVAINFNNGSTTTKDSTKEKEDQQQQPFAGYPLCHYCLNRVRTVCDFVSFMRSIRDGVWKVDEESGMFRAWEECIRLKERMFWARIGGSFPSFVGPMTEDNSSSTSVSVTGVPAGNAVDALSSSANGASGSAVGAVSSAVGSEGVAGARAEKLASDDDSGDSVSGGGDGAGSAAASTIAAASEPSTAAPATNATATATATVTATATSTEHSATATTTATTNTAPTTDMSSEDDDEDDDEFVDSHQYSNPHSNSSTNVNSPEMPRDDHVETETRVEE